MSAVNGFLGFPRPGVEGGSHGGNGTPHWPRDKRILPVPWSLTRGVARGTSRVTPPPGNLGMWKVEAVLVGQY